MKNKKILFIVLGIILFLLIGSSIFINFIAKSSAGLSYVVLVNLLVGILGSIALITLGNKYLTDKKQYQILFVGFLILVFTFAISVLNVVVGYKNLVNMSSYDEYMVYVSSITNLYIYLFFTLVIGVINLHMYINKESNR